MAKPLPPLNSIFSARQHNLPPPGSWMRALLSLALLEGLAVIIYLFSLPSDSDSGGFLGFSAARWALFGLLLAAWLTAAALLVVMLKRRKVADYWSEKLFGSRSTFPMLLLSLATAGLMLLGWMVLFHAPLLLSLNRAVLLRFSAPLLWGLLIILQFTAVWLWLWKPFRWYLPRWFGESAALLLLFIISFTARAPLTGYGLPYQAVWDEVVTYPQSLQMLVVPGLRPYSDVPGYGTASYGDLLVYISAGGQAVGLINGFRTQQVNSYQEYVSPPPGVPSIYSAVHPSGIPLQFPRLLLAFLNSLAPLGIFLACRRYLKLLLPAAFGAGFIYAYLSRDVIYYSSYILPDALGATLFIFLSLAAWEGIQARTARFAPFVISGLLAGMIISVTVRLAGVLAMPFLAFALARCKQRPLPRLASTAASVLVGFFLTSPYALVDLPAQLMKWTAFSWYHELHLAHRLSSLVYYLQGMFMPGFDSGYVDSSAGSVGLGVLAGILALLGFWWMLPRYPRQALFLVLFIALHLYMISPVFQRFTRHALILYPLICIAAGAGLQALIQGLRWFLLWVGAKYPASPVERFPRFQAALVQAAPWIVLAFFLLASSSQIRYTYRYINRVTQFRPVQAEVSDYLVEQLPAGSFVGIVDVLPLIHTPLLNQGIKLDQFSFDETLDALRSRGFTHIVATDRLGGDYAGVNAAPGSLLGVRYNKEAEFGYASLLFEGYPVHNLYMFIAPLPDQ